MARPVLDPTTAHTAASCSVSYRLLDPVIQNFGYVINEDALLPADLVLVANGGGKGSIAIETAQRQGGFEAEHARWTHVALYIGGDRVVEATPWHGVRVGTLSTAMFGRPALIRRIINPELSVETRYQIIIHAMQEIGGSYSVAKVPPLAWAAFRRTLWRRSLGGDDQSLRLCSSLVRRAHLSAAEIDIAPGITGIVWPADLSRSKRLADVDVGWVKLAR